MSFPPLQPPASSTPAAEPKPPTSSLTSRPRQPAWGLPAGPVGGGGAGSGSGSGSNSNSNNSGIGGVAGASSAANAPLGSSSISSSSAAPASRRILTPLATSAATSDGPGAISTHRAGSGSNSGSGSANALNSHNSAGAGAGAADGQLPTSPTANISTASPLALSFSSVLNSSARHNIGAGPASSSNAAGTNSGSSTFATRSAANSFSAHAAPSSHASSASGSQSILSPRSRTNTPFSNLGLNSAAAAAAAAAAATAATTSTTAAAAAASQAASSTSAASITSPGSGGGTNTSAGAGAANTNAGGSASSQSRGGTFSPSLSSHGLSSPTSGSFDRGGSLSLSSQPGSASAGSSSISKIVVTQLFLLLGSITEKEGKAKWESQAENIRKLIDAHGMDVYAKYLRRLITGSSPQIFMGISRNVENPANYPLLVQEIEKAAQDPEQARRVAEVLDTDEGDMFRDFDLATFLDHFKLDPIGKTIIATALTHVAKPDLGTKAVAVLANNFPALLQSFASPSDLDDDVPETILATAAFSILRALPDFSTDAADKEKVGLALESRFSKQDQPLPTSIQSAMSLAEVFEMPHELADDFGRQTPSATASVEAARDVLRAFGTTRVDEAQITSTLLYMVLVSDADQWDAATFTAAAADLVPSLDWTTVITNLDRPGLIFNQTQFLALYHALIPLVRDGSEFDIQRLWGGQWQNARTQLSLAINFASLVASQLDATSIPNLRRAYDPHECLDGPDGVAQLAEEAACDPMISIDAVMAIGHAVWNNPGAFSSHEAKHARAVISNKLTLFIAAASGIPKPWSKPHEDFFVMRVRGCFLKSEPNYQFLLHLLWKQDKQWLATRLMEVHSQDPITLSLLFDHILEHGWLEELCSMLNGFAIDLAALAHRKNLLDFHAWADAKLPHAPTELTTALSKFLAIKAQDEMRLVRKEQPAPGTVPLAIKTVYTILEFLEEHIKDKRSELNQLERQCMQAFPRLCNYGESFDELIEANGAESNTLPATADLEMQDHYKRMYSGELEVRHIIEGLRDCKTSDDPAKQDLFACMIHGLFDEYACFSEYPLGPLATTAVLFGGIINYRLITNIALNMALEMVLEAVRDYNPNSSMYKFGLQALLHFLNRFHEWPDFCQRLVQIPGLQGTEAYVRAQEALRDEAGPRNGDAKGVDGLGEPKMTNGSIDDELNADALVPHFRSVNVDWPLHSENDEEPEEIIQDKVLFVLNNVTEQNLNTRIADLHDVLEPRFFQWFGRQLVEQRAKSQPNYQPLYLDLLGLLNDRNLWAEVQRETYACIRKILNAPSTMKAPSERTHLKHLGTWLGLLTLARDKPIKHKNISFKELLLEGWETSRLLLVIPFTCEVLAQGVKSNLFKPPNPWIMEVIGLLLELYDLPDLKIQMKFAVEVLLGTFGLPRNGEGMERSTELKKRQMYEAEIQEQMLPEGLEGFDEMAIGNFGKGLRNARFSPPALQELENGIVLPAASSSPINHAQLRQIVATAVHRSIAEIMGPVVERSVTIATIATRDLISKDYALEPSEERVREASEQMAKSLAGSLANVTCKEPMRMSLGNYIRMAASELPDPLPEGAVLMAVNDNLEMACRLVEQQAEASALPEIEPHVEVEVAKRRKHQAEFPNEPYRDPSASHWSTYIPEPYKQTPGGLNAQQLEIYEQFAPQVRGVHGASASQDSGKQIPDVLSETGFSALSGMPSQADAASISQSQGRDGPAPHLMSSLQPVRPPSQVNGFVDPAALQEHVHELLGDLVRAARNTPKARLRDLPRDNAVTETFGRIINAVRNSSEIEASAYMTAAMAYPMLYNGESRSELELEAMAHLLGQMCSLSEVTLAKLVMHFRTQAEDKTFLVPVTAVLLEVGLMEFVNVDASIAQALRERRGETLTALAGLLDATILNAEPFGLRSDFASSLSEVGQWLRMEPQLEPAQTIMRKLHAAGVPESMDLPADEDAQKLDHQMHYIFTEWLTLYSAVDAGDKLLVGFVSQLHQRSSLDPAENMILFLRKAIDASVEALERTNLEGNPQAGFTFIDALAALIVLLVKTQGEGAPTKGGKAAYLRSILSLSILVMNSHQVMRGEHFNQRAFFRLFSMVLYGWHDSLRGISAVLDQQMILTLGEIFLLLEPSNFPGFTYAWLDLVSHRVFMPAILKTADRAGSDLYTRIMEVMLTYVSDLLKPQTLTLMTKELHRGVLRVLLVLHHDFPEFLADNHFRLCNVIPPHCTQLRNLVLSAFPSSILELPDPFSQGLKVDRLDDIRKAPTQEGDIITPLQETGLQGPLDQALQSSQVSDDITQIVLNALLESSHHASHVDAGLLHAIVLYIGQSALAASPSGFASFAPGSAAAVLLSKLAKAMPPEPRYHFLSAVADQLRYPNSHTHWFSHALLHLFGTDQSDARESEVRQQITRILLERLVVHRPHPWGLIITLLELLKNPSYKFWELPFIKAAPEVAKIFETFFNHVNQSSRAMG